MARVRVRVRVSHARRASGCSMHRLWLQVGPGAARFKAEIHFNPQLLSEKCAPLTTCYLLLTTYFSESSCSRRSARRSTLITLALPRYTHHLLTCLLLTTYYFLLATRGSPGTLPRITTWWRCTRAAARCTARTMPRRVHPATRPDAACNPV